MTLVIVRSSPARASSLTTVASCRPPGSSPTTARGAVLLAPAMATPAAFYAPFATWLAESGFHVLTFDYRGTASVEEMKAERGDVLRWAGDAASALEALLEEDLDLPVTWVGHSLGGQLLPFARHDLLDRALMIAAGSGYWRYNQPSIRWRAPLFFRAIAPLAMRAAGYYPGRRLRDARRRTVRRRCASGRAGA